MSRQKKKQHKKSKHNAGNIALAIAIIDLLGHIIDLITKILN